jgi:hypothetical protein
LPRYIAELREPRDWLRYSVFAIEGRCRCTEYRCLYSEGKRRQKSYRFLAQATFRIDSSSACGGEKAAKKLPFPRTGHIPNRFFVCPRRLISGAFHIDNL